MTHNSLNIVFSYAGLTVHGCALKQFNFWIKFIITVFIISLSLFQLDLFWFLTKNRNFSLKNRCSNGLHVSEQIRDVSNWLGSDYSVCHFEKDKNVIVSFTILISQIYKQRLRLASYCDCVKSVMVKAYMYVYYIYMYIYWYHCMYILYIYMCICMYTI